MGPRRRRIGRWGLAIAVTLIVHAVILLPILTEGSWMASVIAPMQLTLLGPQKPPPPEPQHAISPARSAPASTTPPPPVEQPAAPAPQAATPQPSAATQSPASNAQTAEGSAGSWGFMGATGLNLSCFGNQKRLTADERRKCDDKKWAGVGRRDPSDDGRVPPPLIDPNKAAFYDAVLAAKHSPGHGPGFGCGKELSLGEGGSKLIRELKKKRLAKEPPRVPPHAFKFGPLPCYITPPQGFMTPEADVPPMDTFRDGHAPSPPGYIQPIYRDPYASGAPHEGPGH